MNRLRHEDDQEVIDAVEAAATLACEHLDDLFPGKDKSGITSNFQGELVRVLKQMLKGESGRTELPRLVLDNAFFGTPQLLGETFLPTRFNNNNIEALDPDTLQFRDIDQIDDAWETFDDAMRDVLEYIAREELTLDKLVSLGISIKAVRPIENMDSGFRVVESNARAPYPLAAHL